VRTANPNFSTFPIDRRGSIARGFSYDIGKEVSGVERIDRLGRVRYRWIVKTRLTSVTIPRIADVVYQYNNPTGAESAILGERERGGV
jgi:hypothetical protein